MPIIKKVIDETYNNDLLNEACKLCIENDVFIRQLKVLDFFNNDATFPFLNCIENCNQKDILPNLFHDLINNSTDTLSKYKLTMEHINTQKPGSKLSQKIFEDFFLAAVEVIKTQCGREYRFANENEKTRATFLSELHINELEGLPTDNLKGCVCYIFGNVLYV